MRIVLAHDSFTQQGGAERVAFALHEMYPDAPLVTIVVDQKMKPLLEGWNIITSPLQPLYDIHSKFQHWLALIPWAVDNTKVPDADVLLSSSTFFIKGLRKPAGSVHINYCHSPVRFLWTEPEYIKQEVPAMLRPIVRMVFKHLRRWDLASVKRIDYFLANSREVQKRIKEVYGRDSEVVYPFIDESFWKPTKPKGDYFIIAGRLQAHKDNELVIEAFNKLGIALHVVGTGRQEEYLRSIAKPNITFLGRASDEILRDELSGALGLVSPQFEDFGLVPLEAAACGTATIGLAKGGTMETVIPGVTGNLLEEMTVENIMSAVRSWDPSRYDHNKLLEQAQRFSKSIFEQNIKSVIEKVSPSA